MLPSNQLRIEKLLLDLKDALTRQYDELAALNVQITLDTDYAIRHDFETVIEYLEHYRENFKQLLKANLKPKGKVLLILSYNEPFILSVIPVLNALIAGNEVIVKPSSRALEFVKLVWNEKTLQEHDLKLTFVSMAPQDLEAFIVSSQVKAVYLFGSRHVARDIAQICGAHYVEFYPEIEAADCKVYNRTVTNIQDDTALTLRESFTHAGQSCQRIQGVYVHENNYKEYVGAIKQSFKALCHSEELANYLRQDIIPERQGLIHEFQTDLQNAQAEEVIAYDSLPILLVSPHIGSELVAKAYFLPTIWVVSFSSQEELITLLNKRRFFLGLNVQSDNEEFTQALIQSTRHSRYTLNTEHIKVRSYEGWGGTWPSGFSGYRSWLEHFSNSYIVINEKG